MKRGEQKQGYRYTCSRCGGARTGRAVRAVFFTYAGESLIEEGLSEDMLRSVEEDLCPACAIIVRAYMKPRSMPAENRIRKSRRGRKSLFSAEDDAEILRLYDEEGWSYRVIAGKYHVSDNTIMCHIHQARERRDVFTESDET